MNENTNISTNTVKRTKNKKFNFIDALLIVVAVTVAATLIPDLYSVAPMISPMSYSIATDSEREISSILSG